MKIFNLWRDIGGVGPLNCSSLRSTTNKIVFHWEPPPFGWMKFNVTIVAFEDKVGCGEVLRDDKGVACVLFSGLIVTRGYKMAKIIAIKITLELFIDCGINQLVRVQFIVFHRQGNDMADALAKAECKVTLRVL
ncbi:hypothetical protein PVK06_042249 [Gossypium arboreum]|uniref:RNase H type-1 domain-containing protein n=1 Tax=Gossypium arboreum TaxID=29729 RepID=A0ABR0MMS6_GOSAR|nr:hypothetical protein PVK06_042249 [Gossypium arboreum]